MAHLFFEHTGWGRDLKQPLDILAFDSGQGFDSYRMGPGAFAFYQPTREGDFVLMRSLEPEHYSVVVHEYTHCVIEHAGLKLPIWLNEGLADFYSTMECRRAQVVVGTPPPGRKEALQRRGFMDWTALAAIDRSSPYYRDGDKMLLFYAQSWAFVRVLALDPAYSDKLQSFLEAISGGATAEEATSAVYHKTLPELGHEVEQTLGSKSLEARVLDVDVRPGALQTAEVADAVKQAEFALADVMAANPQLADEAKVQLEALAVKYPNDPRAQESLGFMGMRGGRGGNAEEHLAAAVNAGSKDPEALFRLAHLKIARGGSNDEAIDLLQRVLAADPSHYYARLELGFAAANSKRFDIAANALEGIAKPKPEHAYNVAYTLAFCLAELHRGSQARIYAEQARKTAATSADREQVAGLFNYLEQELPGEVATK